MPAALAVTLTLVAGFYFLRKEDIRAPDILPTGAEESME